MKDADHIATLKRLRDGYALRHVSVAEGQAITALIEEVSRLRAALLQIEIHPHCSHDSNGHGRGASEAPRIQRQYEIGAADGHRCAADIARAALLVGCKRSAVYDAAGRGQIPHLRIGRRIVVTSTSPFRQRAQISRGDHHPYFARSSMPRVSAPCRAGCGEST